MSKYTEWLNKRIETNEEVTFKDFLRVCAWDATPLKKLAPEKLVPVANIDITEELTALDGLIDDAEDEKQAVIAYDAATLQNKIEAKYKEDNDARILDIQNADKIIDKYGDILAQLCEFAPEDAQIQALKTFAMKELQSNMPNLLQYANPPKKESLTVYHNQLKKETDAVYNKLAKEYADKYNENLTANTYINSLETEIENYDKVKNEEAISPVIL